MRKLFTMLDDELFWTGLFVFIVLPFVLSLLAGNALPWILMLVCTVGYSIVYALLFVFHIIKL